MEEVFICKSQLKTSFVCHILSILVIHLMPTYTAVHYASKTSNHILNLKHLLGHVITN